MKRIAVLLIAIALFAVGISIIAAENDESLPNDPNVNPDANACYTGGSMEGQCGDSEYLWIVGWYKIRFDYGLLGRDTFPDLYKWVLPPPPQETPTPCLGGPTVAPSMSRPMYLAPCGPPP